MSKERTVLERQILEALVLGPAHGNVVADRVETATGHRPGSIGLYSTLRRLRDEGVLRSHEEDGPPSRGGRPRTIYTIVKKEDE